MGVFGLAIWWGGGWWAIVGLLTIANLFGYALWDAWRAEQELRALGERFEVALEQVETKVNRLNELENAATIEKINEPLDDDGSMIKLVDVGGNNAEDEKER